MKLLKIMSIILIVFAAIIAVLVLRDEYAKPIEDNFSQKAPKKAGEQATISPTRSDTVTESDESTETPSPTEKPKKKKKKTKTSNPITKPTPTEAPTPTVAPTEKPDTKSFYVGDAPYETIEHVEFSSLININHRLEKSYIPTDLVRVCDYVDSTAVKLNGSYLHANKTAAIAFNDMMNAAEEDGITGFILRNAYRSYDSQVSLWKKRLRENSRYGREHNVPLGSAYPGTSEHQTGLALDILSVNSPLPNSDFSSTKHYKWLKNNSYKFGFILRYRSKTTDLTGIKFEPYHYRYVGVELATELHESNICLEEYYNKPVIYN